MLRCVTGEENNKGSNTLFPPQTRKTEITRVFLKKESFFPHMWETAQVRALRRRDKPGTRVVDVSDEL